MAMHMRTPQRIRLSLSLKPLFRCAQARHFVIFCWVCPPFNHKRVSQACPPHNPYLG